MNFIGCIPRFLKAHAGWVLTALGTAGMVGTVILTARETPKVQETIADAEIDHISDWIEENHIDAEDLADMDDFPKEAYLTTWEKTKIALPIYLPAILLGTGTLACFWGSQIFNVKKQAALVAAYGTLAMQFDQYREAIKAEYGSEADKKAYEISRMEVKRLQEELSKLKEECGPQLYEFAALPGVIFEAKPDQMTNALSHFNRNMTLRGSNTLAELFAFSGIPDCCYDKDLADQHGWQEYENEVDYGARYVDFYYDQVKNSYGRTVNIINTYVPPYELDVDYGFEGNPEEHLYDGQNFALAEAYASAMGKSEIIPVDPDHTVYALPPF